MLTINICEAASFASFMDISVTRALKNVNILKNQTYINKFKQWGDGSVVLLLPKELNQEVEKKY